MINFRSFQQNKRFSIKNELQVVELKYFSQKIPRHLALPFHIQRLQFNTGFYFSTQTIRATAHLRDLVHYSPVYSYRTTFFIFLWFLFKSSGQQVHHHVAAFEALYGERHWHFQRSVLSIREESHWKPDLHKKCRRTVRNHEISWPVANNQGDWGLHEEVQQQDVLLRLPRGGAHSFQR